MIPEQQNKPAKAQQREHAEPSEGLKPVPVVVLLATLALVLFGAGYIFVSEPFGRPDLGDQRTLADLEAKPATATAASAGAADGTQVFTANCVACHQASGKGIPGVFPNLDGSEWVSHDARVMINILLHGITGEMTVNGAAYNGAMPSFAHLSDAELAAVASHVRSSWSNHLPAVTAEQVAEVRKDQSRTAPFAGEADLQAMMKSLAPAP